MFYSYWIPFILTAVVLNITPGPDMIYLITQSISLGKKAGFASILGFGTGALIHSLFAVLGITAIMTASIAVFHLLKIFGAAYLFFLGINALLQPDSKFSVITNKERKISFIKSYLNAVIVDVTNPKVAIFFMALLPQFYRENGSSRLFQFMSLAMIIVVIAFIIEGIIVILSDRIALLLKEKPVISKIIDKSFGSILIFLGFRLFLEEQP